MVNYENQVHHKEGVLEDSVAVDAKRILLRYGAPISILDGIEEGDRITIARTVSRTPLADRSDRLQELLVEHGYLEGPPVKQTSRRTRKKKVTKE